MNLSEAINEGASLLKKKNIPNFFLDSEILMGKILGKEREYLVLNHNLKITDKDYSRYISLIRKRVLNKPVAYLTNNKDFWKNKFYVDERVLIPRPDTEILIEEIIGIIKSKKINNFLEVGVGSGCIVLSILKEIKNLNAVGIDISRKAIEICKINSKRFNLCSRLKLYKSDIDKFSIGKYDLIVSNPPYICRSKLRDLEKNVLDYEPIIALDGGLDGTLEIKKVIKAASKLIKVNGKFVIEVGFDQKFKVKNLLKNNGFFVNKVIKDYSNHDRCIVSTKINK